jgi:hypothetical protein
MRCPGTDDPAGNLNDHIGGGDTHAEFAPKGEDQGNSRIEMRAGHRAEDGDQHHEAGTCGNGVTEERNRNISTGQAIAHDPGAYDDCEKQPCAERLGCQARREVEALKWRL